MKKTSHKELTEEGLFNIITEDDILQVKDGEMHYRERPLTREEVTLLKESAEMFRQGLLFKVMKTEMQFQANKAMFYESQNIYDLMAGKIMLKFWRIFENKLKDLSQ